MEEGIANNSNNSIILEEVEEIEDNSVTITLTGATVGEVYNAFIDGKTILIHTTSGYNDINEEYNICLNIGKHIDSETGDFIYCLYVNNYNNCF